MSGDEGQFEPAVLDERKENEQLDDAMDSHKLDNGEDKHDGHMDLTPHNENGELDDDNLKVDSPSKDKILEPTPVENLNDESNNLEGDLLKDTHVFLDEPADEVMDDKARADMELIKNSVPTSQLEIALSEALSKRDAHVLRLTNEIRKLKKFISKRKQTYKRKRKDDGAPTRALSAYNIFIQDRFKRLAKENENALKSTDSDAQLQRVPPANLVAATGNEWKDLPDEEKAKYEERAKGDKQRYQEEMAKYQPPDRSANRKRNKTGYNMFFSAHVLRLKQSEQGVPSERGSVARLVGTAWKALSAEEKQYYEREADKHNGMHPLKDDVDDDDDDEGRRHHQHGGDPYAHMHHDMQYGQPPMHGHHPPQHDPRHHGYAPYPPHHMYGQPHGYYDYGHHQQQQPPHHSQHRGQSRTHQQGYNQNYPPPPANPYDRM